MRHLKVIPIIILCAFVSALLAEDNGIRRGKVLEPGTKVNLAGVKITLEKAQFRTPSYRDRQFRLDNLQPGKHQNSVDPGCLVEVDASIDPGIRVRVDPKVDPDMIVKIPPESSTVILKKDTLK